MRVIYTVELSIDAEAASKTLAIHEAGERWPELRDAITTQAVGVAIKHIRVEGDKREAKED